MSEEIKLKVTAANRWIFQNLFWIVPAHFLLIIGGIGTDVFKSNQGLRIQEKIKTDISVQLRTGELLQKKQDSVLQNTKELRNLINKQ